MQQALEKYKTMASKQQWLKKTDEELEFIAMQAKMKVLEQNPKPRAVPAIRDPTKTARDKAKAAAAAAAAAAGNNRNSGKFAWKGVAPKTGEAHEKTVNGKAYIHCPHHGNTKWVLKVNQQGVEPKTGCRMMAEANATGGDRLTAAVANIEEEDDKEQI
jgi:hypothetical protein